MVQPIDEFVIQEALRQICRWRQTRPEVTVSVNLSPLELEDAGLLGMLARAIETNGASRDALCIQVSEQAIAHDPEASIRVMQGLRRLASAWPSTTTAPAHRCRPTCGACRSTRSRSMRASLTRAGSDPSDANVVGAVVELGHALGMRVVAEGVETTPSSTGVRRAQGFLFSPGPAGGGRRPSQLPADGGSDARNAESGPADRANQRRRAELAAQAGDVAVDDVCLGGTVPDSLDRALARRPGSQTARAAPSRARSARSRRTLPAPRRRAPGCSLSAADPSARRSAPDSEPISSAARTA